MFGVPFQIQLGELPSAKEACWLPSTAIMPVTQARSDAAGVPESFLMLRPLQELPEKGVVVWTRTQVSAGASAVQLFDSWVGAVAPDDYRRYVMPYSERIFAAFTDGDVDGLVGMLAEDVVVYGDGGGKAPQWMMPIVGAANVGRVFAAMSAEIREYDVAVELHQVNGQPGVIPGSPAEQAGIKPGDVITKIDGRAIARSEDLIIAIRAKAPGDTVVLTVKRDGKEQDITVTLAADSEVNFGDENATPQPTPSN